MNEISLFKLEAGSPELPEIEAINSEAFPPNEQVSVADMIGFITDGRAEVLGIRADEKPVGYFSLMRYGKTVWIWFFAVSRECRGQGIGSRALALLAERYPGCRLLVEAESLEPETANGDQRKRRLAFYARNGFSSTGWFVFYMETEFAILVTGQDLSIADYEACLAAVRSRATSFRPRLYRKDV